jgi:hypothetical protein
MCVFLTRVSTRITFFYLPAFVLLIGASTAQASQREYYPGKQYIMWVEDGQTHCEGVNIGELEHRFGVQARRLDAPGIDSGETWTQSLGNFSITLNGFPAEAIAAFEFAVDIWSTLVVAPVEVRINVDWEALPQGHTGGRRLCSHRIRTSQARVLPTWTKRSFPREVRTL